MGCGAVGAALSVALALGGAEVYVISRSRFGCSREPVEVRGLGSGLVNVCGWPEAPRESDALIFATKAYDVPAAVDLSLSHGFRPRIAVSVQNGLGSLELVESAFHSSAGGLLYLGLTRLGECRALYTGGRRVVLGCRRQCDHEALRGLADVLASGGLEVEVAKADDFEGERWLKLAVNTAINPLTLITWSRNGRIASDKLLAETASAIAAETGRVGEALGVRLPEDPAEATLRTARETSENCSSTVQDVAGGRRTELEYLNMAVWERSLRLSFRATLNLLAYESAEAAAGWLKGRRSPCEG